MSNLTSTIPYAFNALYGLLVTAGQAQSPKVQVFHTALTTQEPDQYVVLGETPSGRPAVEHQGYEFGALGSYAQYETYCINGYATYLQGNFDPQTVMSDTWALYQNVVMATVVANRGSFGQGAVLGETTNPISWIVPDRADYIARQGQYADGTGGFAGTVEFGFSVKARLTVP